MANDCPHRKQLESTLRACHDHTELIATARNNYLNIIGELKRDLDELTVEVEQCRIKEADIYNNEEPPNQQQQQHQQHHQTQASTAAAAASSSRAVRKATNGLEAAMYALAEQNERLQQALLEKCGIVASTQHATNAHIHQLEKHNADLCDNIKCLTEQLRDRDNAIERLNCQIARQAAGFEKASSDEIKKLKEEICDQARCLHKMSSMLNSEKQNRLELRTKFDALQNSSNTMNQQLLMAKSQVSTLEDNHNCTKKQNEDMKIERKMLREEIFCLKEKEGVLLERERCLSEQLQQANTELAKARQLIHNMQQAMDQNDQEYCNLKAKLQQAEKENTQQLCQLKNDICQLQTDLEQQIKINMQKEKILDSFRKWQDDQRQSDEVMRDSLQKSEEHIQLLMEDNRHYVEEYREISRCLEIQECELQRLKSCGMSGSRQAGGGIGSGNNSANNDAATSRLDYLQNTIQRAAEQRRSLRTSTSIPSDDHDDHNDKDNGNSNKSVR